MSLRKAAANCRPLHSSSLRLSLITIKEILKPSSYCLTTCGAFSPYSVDVDSRPGSTATKLELRWVPRMLTEDHKAARVVNCQEMLTRDDGMNGTFFLSTVTMNET
ncbi:hypothetical protein FHG87_012910 [Trinorchestia longiramus]|nr:hypothetical protein FHG87_012910 [Trinorchestia longiramus]